MRSHARSHWNSTSYRTAAGLVLLALMACSSSSTDTKATRYNFAVVDGMNQHSTAGAATLAKPITAELTRDPSGKFANGAFDFLKPSIAYAQGITLSGEPVANQIVCGRESNVGEPKVVPLCAYTLADGKAANTVQGGTKAGTYNILFTAQVPSEAPVVDSTTVTVDPGAPATVDLVNAYRLFVPIDGSFDLHVLIASVRDKYENEIDWKKLTPSYAIRNGSEVGDPTPDATSWTVPWEQKFSSTGPLTGAAPLYLYVWFGDVRFRSAFEIVFA